MTTKENYNRWLNSNRIDAQTKEQLLKMSQAEIDDAFFKDVEFGTAGMRGVLGPGTNRLNDFTVKKATGIYCYRIFLSFQYTSVYSSSCNRLDDRRSTV